MTQLMEDYDPLVRQSGINSNKNAIFGGNLSITGNLTVTGTTTIAGLTLTDLTTTGNTVIGNAVTDTLTISGATSITSSSASSLAVGLNGATTPAFVVDSSTASQAAGLKVVGATTTGTVAVVTIGGASVNLTINATGTGTIGIGSVSTGAVTITPATTITGLATLTGGFTSVANAILKSGTAVPATAGSVAAGVPVTAYSNGMTIEWTTDAPTHVRPKGSLVLNINGSSTSTRAYINTDGSTAWAAVTTAS
jgi:hypothetical protein